MLDVSAVYPRIAVEISKPHPPAGRWRGLRAGRGPYVAGSFTNCGVCGRIWDQVKLSMLGEQRSL